MHVKPFGLGVTIMSRNSLSGLISALRAANVELLIAAELPHAEALAAAREKASATEQALTQARIRTEGAYQALELVERTAAGSTDSTLTDAVAAAQAECSAASSAYVEALAHDRAAKEELDVVQAPVQAYLSIRAALASLLEQPDGQLEDGACTVSRLAAQAATRAKSQHPSIASAEAEVRRTAQVCGQASEASREADRANRNMQRAYSLSATEPNRLAADGTKQRWEAATSVEATASEASSAAHVAHEAALRLVKAELDLLNAATSLAQQATRIDEGVRQTAASEAAYEARDTRYEYDGDRCSCSETSELSCNYCRSLQERISNRDRDNDPTR